MELTLSNSLMDLAARIAVEHELVRAAAQRGVAHAVAAGDLLIEAKRRVEHGQWLDWLDGQCGISSRTAQAYMRLSREMPKLPPANAQRVADLSFRQAMNVLASGPRVATMVQAVDEAAEEDPARFGRLLDDVERTGRVNGVFRRLSNMKQADRIRAAPPVLPTGPFHVLVADWPSAYESDRGDPTQRGILPYPTMTFDEICAVPVARLAMPSSVLGFWTNNMLCANGTAGKIIDAWGFTPITMITWDKIDFITGDMLRGVTEQLILATRGKPLIVNTTVSTLYRAKRKGPHSTKPDGIYDILREIFPAPEGGYLELFARKARPGWIPYGDQAPQAEAAE